MKKLKKMKKKWYGETVYRRLETAGELGNFILSERARVIRYLCSET